MSNIWLPGKGLVPPHVYEANKAIEQYDHELGLARDEETGLWAVVVKRGPEGRPFPVFNLGHELPGPDRIQQLLYTNDVRRHGHKLVENIQRHNDAIQRELDWKAHQASEETAEHIEHAFRRMGKHPTSRVFVPGKD